MIDTEMPHDDIGGSKPTQSLTSTNNYYCRGRRTGLGDYVVCLELPPHHCGYALHLGEEYLCLHPDHLTFADRTEVANRESLKIST
jgi:hypothetical protein